MRVGDQFELRLEDTIVRVPWNGASPRGLTRVALSPIFKAQAAKARATILMDAQCDLFEARQEECLRVYAGAPLLLEP